MQDVKFIRRKNVIITLGKDSDGNVTESPETFKSVNKAKRKSRELQLANGGLGVGSLVVE